MLTLFHHFFAVNSLEPLCPVRYYIMMADSMYHRMGKRSVLVRSIGYRMVSITLWIWLFTENLIRMKTSRTPKDLSPHRRETLLPKLSLPYQMLF